MRKPRLVLVEWEDSRQAESHWRWGSDISDEPAVQCTTVGYLVRRTKQVVVVAQSMGDPALDDAQYAGVKRIPARCVVRIRPLTFRGN